MLRTLVITHHDVDCDGLGVSFHRVEVPAEITDANEIVRYAMHSEQLSSYYDGAFPLSDSKRDEFERDLAETGSEWDREYWAQNGYHSQFYARFTH